MQLADPLLERILAAVVAWQAGAADAAAGLAVLVPAAERGDALHRCLLAHFLAEAQPDPAQELSWDLRALQVADELSDARLRAWQPTLSVAAFRPSLLLNVAASYRKVGDVAMARATVAQAQAASLVLADDGYGRLIRGGIARIAQDLAGCARKRPRRLGLTGQGALPIIRPTRDRTGAVAQLGERDVRNVEVRGSIPLGSTN